MSETRPIGVCSNSMHNFRDGSVEIFVPTYSLYPELLDVIQMDTGVINSEALLKVSRHEDFVNIRRLDRELLQAEAPSWDSFPDVSVIHTKPVEKVFVEPIPELTLQMIGREACRIIHPSNDDEYFMHQNRDLWSIWIVASQNVEIQNRNNFVTFIDLVGKHAAIRQSKIAQEILV